MNTRLERFRTSLEQNAADGTLLEDLIEEFAPAIPDWEVSECWRWAEWPRRSEFDLPPVEDGVDLVAEKTDGRLIAIQAKGRSGDTVSPTDIQKLVGAAPEKIFGERWFVTTVKQTAGIERVLQNTGVIWKDALVELSPETLDRAAAADDDDPRTAMQAEAVERCVDALQHPQPELLEHWRKAGAKLDYLPTDVGRVTLVLPCGTGKTRISAQVVDRLCADGDLAVMLVPSIALIPQARQGYLATLHDARRQPVTIAVCSDRTAGHVSPKDEERRTDDPTADTGHTHATEIGCRTARSEAEVRKFIEQDCRNDRLNVLFSTYQSAHHVAEALRRTKRHAQVLVCDEAHRTAQIKQIRRQQIAERIRNFTICHDQAGFPARYRLYQTATPKIYPADNKRVQNLDRTKYVVHSMSDASVFGGVAYRVSYQSAVENDLLTDYRIVAFGVDEAAWAAADRICRQIEAKERKEKRRQSALGTADALAWLIYGIVLYGGVGSDEAGDRVRIRRSLAFLNRTARSKAMAGWLRSADGREEIEAYFLAKKLPAPTGSHDVIHLDATHSAAQRRAELMNLANVNEGDTAGITNVGIFGEGTDTPSLDAVAILAPRKSPTDVIQIVGRCMRRSPEKTTGYVIVPVALPRGLDAETSLGMTELGEEWKPLSQILTAMRAHDGRIEDRVHDLLDIYVPPDERSELERAIVAVDGNVVRTGVWKGPVDSSPEEVIRRVSPPAWRERPGRRPTELSDYLTAKDGFTWSEQRVVNDRPTDRITDRGPEADQELLKKFPAVDIIRRDRRGVRMAPHVKPVGTLDGDDGGFDVTETVSKARAQANNTALLREPRPRRMKRAAPAAPGESPSLWEKLESHDPTRGLAVEVMERSGLRGNPTRDFNLLQEPLHDAAGALRADGLEAELRIRLGMEPAGRDGTALGEESGASACQIASLLILNALILHARLEGTSSRVRELIGDCTLDSIGKADDPCAALSDGWTRVLEYDYRPVFEPARNVVNWLRDSERRVAGWRAVRRLAGWAAENADHYASMGMEYAGELFSRVMGHQAADGAFFTRPEAARLLAELALDEMDVERFSNAAEWPKLKTADLACGSGMLLNAWIEAVKERMRAEGAHEEQCSTWHRMAVEGLASGLDKNPVSLQLAAGRFTLGNLEIDYRKMELYALEHGKTASGAVRLGALELLGDDEFVGAAPDTFDWADDHIVHPDVKASLRGTRCVIMNPPYSDNVKRNRNLVCCPGNTHRNTRHLVENRLRGGDPHERRGRGIVAVDERLDLAHQIRDAAERAPLDRPLAEQAEPPLHLVQPGRVGGCEVQMEAWPRRQPLLDLGVLVRRVVVQYQVDVQLRRHLPVDQAQERQELLVAVPLPALADHPAGGDVQGGKQCRRAVPDVVVGVAFDVAQAHRQRRLGAIERLNLRLLVHTQDHRVVRRVEVQPDNVAHFLDEERVGGQLEGLRQVRLDPEQSEPTLHRALGNALGTRQRARAPVRGGVGRLPQRTADDRCYLVVVIGPGPTGSEFVVQALDAGRSEAPSPLADGLRCDADAPGDGSVGQAFGAGENHAGPLHQGVGQGGRVSNSAELILLLVGEREWCQ